MRWTAPAITITLGLLVLTATSQLAGAQSRENSDPGPQARRPSHHEHDRATDAAFSSTVDAQGNARFSIAAGDFLLEKVLAPSGDATIRLTQDQDVVTVAVNHSGYMISRGKKSARLDAQSGQQEDLDSVRALLLGSPSVRTFRRLSSALENRDERDGEGPLILSALVDGDSGTSERIGRRITRKRRAAFHQAKLRPDNLFTDCTLRYEMSLVETWDLFSQCRDTAFNNRWYVWFSAENLCELEFLLRSQQYIY